MVVWEYREMLPNKKKVMDRKSPMVDPLVPRPLVENIPIENIICLYKAS